MASMASLIAGASVRMTGFIGQSIPAGLATVSSMDDLWAT
jgi:hypothetical protein